MRVKDKSDRATVEQVLDPRTRMILFKFLQKSVISSIDGCISTGKEANVYFAESSSGPLAVKVYKTSILTFKDRDRYVSGEFRYRRGYCKHNPRKMVGTWAEKEMRNLSRIYQAGLPCPKPVALKGHVLVMEFLGENGWPFPQLKEVDLDSPTAQRLYHEVMFMIRDLYRKCRLVHADMSEYNLIYKKGELFLIDVSQSVEHDHPHSLEFLRRDCANINVDPTVDSDQAAEKYLDHAQRNSEGMNIGEVSAMDDYFMRTFIPKKLEEVLNFEKDALMAQKGTKPEVFYPVVTGLKEDLSGAKATEQEEMLTNDSDNSLSETSSVGENSSTELGEQNSLDKRPRGESPNSRKLRKGAVKEAQREKRKTKLPKHVKKRREKLSKANAK